MSVSTRPDSYELADYLGVLRRHWWVVVMLTCVGVLLAGTYAKLAPKTYTASVLVYVSSAISTGNSAVGRTNGPVNMDNEAQIVQSDTVATLAQKALHSPLSTADLLKQVTVAVPPNTTVLQINCSAPTAAESALCANDFGAAFLTNRLDTAEAAVSNEIASLQKSQAALRTQVADLRARLKALPPNSPHAIPDQLSLNAAGGQLTQVEAGLNTDLPQLATMQERGNTLAGYVTTPATPPLTPSSPRKLLLLPSGLLAGLLLGLLLAFFADRRDQRVHASRDVERYLDIPVLLDIAPKKPGLDALVSPRSKAGRAFAELAQYVEASMGEGHHVLLVADTSSKAGGSVVAANLAVTLARTRSEVVLVCTDLRGTITPQLLTIHDRHGLAEILGGSATVSEVARRPAEVPRLSVITLGMDISGALRHLQHEATKRLVSDLRKDARYVIIEAQSVGEDADAFSLSEFADAALLAVEISGTMRPDALNCIHRLDRLRIPVLGAAVVPALGRKPPPRQRGRTQPTRQVALPPRPAAAPPPKDLPVQERAGADQPGPRVRPGAPPAAAQMEDPAEPSRAMAPRGPAETWPLPRVALPQSPERLRMRAERQDPPDKAAGA
jgi:capsular polysaccharide biosynthesis protein/Mrp family chromosome partitioning ATPase